MSRLARAREFATYLVYLKRLGSRWAKPLSKNAIWPLPPSRVGSSGELIIPSLGTPIPNPDTIGIEVLKSVTYAVDLHKRGGAKFEFEDDSAQVTVDGMKFKVFNSADVNMLHEVFCERLYNLHFRDPMLVLDLGANLGAAALYFAKHYGADVQAYELVPSTAAIARLNLQLNPDLARKIVLHEYGVADEEKHLRIPCNPLCRPSNSLYSPSGEATAKFEEVTAKPIAPIINEALAELGGRKLLVKLDAEGAEYGIIRRLAQSKLLSKIDILILEWHALPEEKPQEIRDLLAAAGFVWFEREHDSAPVGIISAIRR